MNEKSIRSSPGSLSEAESKSRLAQSEDSGGPHGNPAVSDANLVHDIRTPMVAVRGYTRMLLEEREGPLNPTQREYLTIVLENAQKVIRLLNDSERLERKESQ
jgi:hypothetical protein